MLGQSEKAVWMRHTFTDWRSGEIGHGQPEGPCDRGDVLSSGSSLLLPDFCGKKAVIVILMITIKSIPFIQ